MAKKKNLAKKTAEEGAKKEARKKGGHEARGQETVADP